MQSWKRIVVPLVALLTLQGAFFAEAKSKAPLEGTYTIIHAIPSGFGADIVDVYANNVLLVDNATPGSIRTVSIPKGFLEVDFYANGIIPSETSTPLLSSERMYLGSGADFSYVAHLTADEKPKLTTFRNMVTAAGSKRSWMTFRHIAAAPSTQFRIDNRLSFLPIGNGDQRKRSYLIKTYAVSATLPDSTTVVVAPVSFALSRDTNTVVYLWGAKSKGNLAFLKQETRTKR